MKKGVVLFFIAILFLTACNNKPAQSETTAPAEQTKPVAKVWNAPDTNSLTDNPNTNQIKYGRALISNTAFYLGPKGTVKHISNGMNCQNCHLWAGTKPYGNNYSAVAANYPKFRERSGTVETIYKRVNDCIERSLNGKALDTTSAEMQAIKAYIEWLGHEVPAQTKPLGAGITELAYLDQAANPQQGKLIYTQKCSRCHGENGDGKLNENKIAYQYPPLWGEHSYNTGAGLYRISRLAGYVKSNMPFDDDVDYEHPQLSDEEAWNVAAFINTQPRPKMDISKDWPDISTKPVDHPFGPYADGFTEKQHKYGPFLPIAESRKQKKN